MLISHSATLLMNSSSTLGETRGVDPKMWVLKRGNRLIPGDFGRLDGLIARVSGM